MNSTSQNQLPDIGRNGKKINDTEILGMERIANAVTAKTAPEAPNEATDVVFKRNLARQETQEAIIPEDKQNAQNCSFPKSDTIKRPKETRPIILAQRCHPA